MSKLTLTDITSGYALTTTINANNALIEAALENTLSRDGSTPNTMSAALDMNSQNINNLPDATQNQQPVTLAQAATIAGVTNPLTRETVGAVFYPATATETANTITPTNYYYPPGDIRRYGDNTTPGTTNMTTAFQNMLNSGASEMLIHTDDILVDPSASNDLSASDVTLRTLGGWIIHSNETNIGSAVAVLTVSGNDNVVDLKFDFNTFGNTCVKLTGDRNYVKAIGKDGEGSASSNGDESVILCTGDDNYLWAEQYNCSVSAGPNGNVPRIITIQGNSVDNSVEMIRGRTCVCGLVTASTVGVTVEYLDLEGVEDNGVYLLTGGNEIQINGGRINGAGEPLVLAGHDIMVSNLDITDPISAIGLDGTAERITLNNVRMRHTVTTLENAFIATRASHTSTDGLTLNNCTYDGNVTNGGIAHFSVGSVNNFNLLGGYWELHYTDDSAAGTKIITHATGDEIHYHSPVIKIVDDKTTPMTSGDIINLDIPTLTNKSSYVDVIIVNTSAATIREGSTGGWSQDVLYVRSGSAIANGGLYLSGTSASGTQKQFHSGAQPTAGTFKIGDMCWNSVPSTGEPMGWICTSAGSPGTWVPFGGIQTTNAFTVGAHTTLRDFTGTTTAAQALQLLETLVEDLQAQGIIK